MLGSPILYLKGMRAIMFQLSGFDYKGFWRLWVYYLEDQGTQSRL